TLALGLNADVATPTMEHEVLLANLTPGTKYFYSIGMTNAVPTGGDSNTWFKAAPVPGTRQPVRVFAIGDFGTKDGFEDAVRDQYYAASGTNADVWLLLGDNAYDTG